MNKRIPTHSIIGRPYNRVFAVLASMLAAGLAACSTGSRDVAPTLTGISTSTPPVQATADTGETSFPADATPTDEPTLATEGYWIEPGFPYTLAEQIIPVVQEAGLFEASSPDEASLRLVLNPAQDASLQANWVYSLAAPFATVPNSMSWGVFSNYWLSGDMTGLADFGSPPNIIVTPDTFELLMSLIGTPAANIPLHNVTPGLISQTAWSLRPSLAVVPFDALSPEWKALTVDGRSVLDKNTDLTGYPLTLSVGVVTTTDRTAQIAAGLTARGIWVETNRDPARFTELVMTGVTALVRATASMMQARGYDYPARDIMPFLASADILHTSNEVAFTPDCPAPEWEGDTRFCSVMATYPLLSTIGLDVVELTGNHVNDWGIGALQFTLDLYDSDGLIYYGGGRDLDDAFTPKIIAAPDGSRIAFLGCNSAGPWYAFATDETPGAAPCEDWTWLKDTISTLKANNQADVVVVTLQYWERQRYEPTDQQVVDFTALIDAGADIVSGSHAHWPQGFAFVDGRFIHYGVGNLFFDQMQALGYRQMFADRHIIYDGRHISTVLFTGLMYDYSQPRPMTPDERKAFLSLIFEASGW